MKKIILTLLALSISLWALDINTATFEELTSIKGIGEKKAEAIIKYRETNGKFKNVEDLAKVKGIGDAIIYNVKNDIKNTKEEKTSGKSTKKNKKTKTNKSNKTADK